MRHQIRTMLNQLAENGRLGVPATPSTSESEDEGRNRPHDGIPERVASNLRKAQAAAQHQQQQG